MNHRPDFTSEENDFTLYLQSSFLQLCWCSSFEETRARHLIKLVRNVYRTLVTGCFESFLVTTVLTMSYASDSRSKLRTINTFLSATVTGGTEIAHSQTEIKNDHAKPYQRHVRNSGFAGPVKAYVSCM